MGASNLKLVFISSTWDCTTFHNFLPMFKKKKIKSWQVYDWLAKWLIMSGYMDLRRPRVYRRSNVGLVFFYSTASSAMNSSAANLWADVAKPLTPTASDARAAQLTKAFGQYMVIWQSLILFVRPCCMHGAKCPLWRVTSSKPLINYDLYDAQIRHGFYSNGHVVLTPNC